MTNNLDVKAAWKYHDATRHSYSSVRTNPHLLDFSNQPLPFKIYPALEPSRMPTEVLQTGVAALSAIAGSSAGPTCIPSNAALNLEAVAELLYLSAGITRQRKYSGGEIYFRAAACTGALYEVELYLVCGDVCGDLPKLQAGVYHFAPAEFGLRQLRAGDYRNVLVEAAGGEASLAHAPLTIVCTCTYWRNAWKYQARTYRHFGWDNGTLIANLLAVATALGLPAKVVCGFVDATVNRLLDVDAEREVAFSLIALGHGSEISSQTHARVRADIPPLGFETRHYFARVHAGLDQLDGDAAAHRLPLLAQPHLAHAALADCLEQMIRADDHTGGRLARSDCAGGELRFAVPATYWASGAQTVRIACSIWLSVEATGRSAQANDRNVCCNTLSFH